MTTHPTDDLPAFAVGTLEPEEAGRVEAHLRGCDTCRAELEEHEQTLWRLAEAVAQDPPAATRSRVIAQARAERAPAARSVLERIWDVVRRPVPVFVPAALILLLVVSVAGYAAARRDADRYLSALTSVQNARVIALAPSAEQPQARGALVVPANGTTPYLLLGLPPTPSGTTWQAWVIRGDTPLAAGLSGGADVIFLTVPLQAGDVVAVTLESASGASKPTSTPVLTGKTG